MESTEIQKPEGLTEEHLSYLDDLRESGATNMFGAGSYLAAAFPELEIGQAKKILGYWMKTFEKRNKQ